MLNMFSFCDALALEAYFFGTQGYVVVDDDEVIFYLLIGVYGPCIWFCSGS